VIAAFFKNLDYINDSIWRHLVRILVNRLYLESGGVGSKKWMIPSHDFMSHILLLGQRNATAATPDSPASKESIVPSSSKEGIRFIVELYKRSRSIEARDNLFCVLFDYIHYCYRRMIRSGNVPQSSSSSSSSASSAVVGGTGEGAQNPPSSAHSSNTSRPSKSNSPAHPPISTQTNEASRKLAQSPLSSQFALVLDILMRIDAPQYFASIFKYPPPNFVNHVLGLFNHVSNTSESGELAQLMKEVDPIILRRVLKDFSGLADLTLRLSGAFAEDCAMLLAEPENGALLTESLKSISSMVQGKASLDASNFQAIQYERLQGGQWMQQLLQLVWNARFDLAAVPLVEPRKQATDHQLPHHLHPHQQQHHPHLHPQQHIAKPRSRKRSVSSTLSTTGTHAKSQSRPSRDGGAASPPPTVIVEESSATPTSSSTAGHASSLEQLHQQHHHKDAHNKDVHKDGKESHHNKDKDSHKDSQYKESHSKDAHHNSHASSTTAATGQQQQQHQQQHPKSPEASSAPPPSSNSTSASSSKMTGHVKVSPLTVTNLSVAPSPSVSPAMSPPPPDSPQGSVESGGVGGGWNTLRPLPTRGLHLRVAEPAFVDAVETAFYSYVKCADPLVRRSYLRMVESGMYYISSLADQGVSLMPRTTVGSSGAQKSPRQAPLHLDPEVLVRKSFDLLNVTFLKLIKLGQEQNEANLQLMFDIVVAFCMLVPPPNRLTNPSALPSSSSITRSPSNPSTMEELTDHRTSGRTSSFSSSSTATGGAPPASGSSTSASGTATATSSTSGFTSPGRERPGSTTTTATVVSSSSGTALAPSSSGPNPTMRTPMRPIDVSLVIDYNLSDSDESFGSDDLHFGTANSSSAAAGGGASSGNLSGSPTGMLGDLKSSSSSQLDRLGSMDVGMGGGRGGNGGRGNDSHSSKTSIDMIDLASQDDSPAGLFMRGRLDIIRPLLELVSIEILLHLFTHLPPRMNSATRPVVLHFLTERCKHSASDLDTVGGSSFFKKLLTENDPLISYLASRFLIDKLQKEQPDNFNMVVNTLLAKAVDMNDEKLVSNPYLQIKAIFEMNTTLRRKEHGALFPL